MTCNDKCIHFPVCEQKKYDFANIDECQYYEEKRPHGEWICEGAMADYTNVLVFRCSVCEEHFVGHAEDIKSRHFCPNCGADMREGDSDA